MFKDFIDKAKGEFPKSLEFLKKELLKIRTSQLSPSLVEDIQVDCFGQTLPLKKLASIALGSSRELILEPWDKIYLEPIEKAIANAHLDLSVSVSDGKITLRAPLVTGEYKENLLKLLAQKKEEAREQLRRQREQIWKDVQDAFRKKALTEDDKFRAKDELQKLVEDINQKIESICERKKKEILS